MGLRGLIRKKGDDADDLFGSSANPILDPITGPASSPAVNSAPPPRPRPPSYDEDLTPEFTIIRSDTHTQEVVYPPEFADSPPPPLHDEPPDAAAAAAAAAPASRQRHSFGVFRRTASVLSRAGNGGGDDTASTHSRRRLSHRLHLGRSPSTSSHVPANLPDIVVPEDDVAGAGAGGASAAGAGAGAGAGAATGPGSGKAPATTAIVEAQWEKRATILALENDRRRSSSSRPGSPPQQQQEQQNELSHPPPPPVPSGGTTARRGSASSPVSSKELDETIQEAIRLHEAGQLEQSTRLFGRLADPRGQNNPLSQVLYGLALRHGWGCPPDTEQAVRYLSAAASNAAAVEEMALQAGLRKGGAAKGELVLAIFELANCFRHGWGLDKDPIAAKQYYETAANLGDTDAMNEVAWCYLEGFGCKKDKFLSAKYYRLAEQSGNKTLGNTWIWKEKYDPDKQKKKK